MCQGGLRAQEWDRLLREAQNQLVQTETKAFSTLSSSGMTESVRLSYHIMLRSKIFKLAWNSNQGKSNQKVIRKLCLLSLRFSNLFPNFRRMRSACAAAARGWSPPWSWSRWAWPPPSGRSCDLSGWHLRRISSHIPSYSWYHNRQTLRVKMYQTVNQKW